MKVIKIFSPYRILLLLSSAWMMGTGLRFIIMQEYNYYQANLFDKIFDWGGLFVLGLLIMVSTIYKFIKKGGKNET